MRKKSLLVLPVIAVLIVIMLAIYASNRPEPSEGSKSVGITVIDDEGGESQYFIATDAMYLREVMDELSEENADFTYGGEEGEYGYYVNEVNGVEADNMSAYWGFYINGEYCSYGIDSQPVSDGDICEIVYEEIK